MACFLYPGLRMVEINNDNPKSIIHPYANDMNTYVLTNRVKSI